MDDRNDRKFTISICLTRKVIEWLNDITPQTGLSRSAIIELVLRQTKTAGLPEALEGKGKS
jgi:hypothetical protein